MRREAQNVLLLLLGGALFKIALDGSFLRYVKPSLHPYLLISGVLIVVLAVAAMVRDIRWGGHVEEGHNHGTRPYWLLVVPAAVILFLAPPALGASSVGGSSMTQTVSAEKKAFAPLPTGSAPDVPLLDVVQRAVRDSTGSLVGRDITVTGFAVATSNGGSPRSDGSTSGVDLARVLIICCAADARSIRIHLDGALGDISDGTWLSVQGVIVPGSATSATKDTPTLTVRQISRIPAPANTYSYS